MRILVVGAGGHVGRVAVAEFEARGHEVISASRSTDPGVDTSDPASIQGLLDAVGEVDAIVVAAGSVPFKPVTDLTRDDYLSALTSKVL
ncbi:short chain dehydrogenase, partial [Burkholderia multivorans]